MNASREKAIRSALLDFAHAAGWFVDTNGNTFEIIEAMRSQYGSERSINDLVINPVSDHFKRLYPREEK